MPLFRTSLEAPAALTACAAALAAGAATAQDSPGGERTLAPVVVTVTRGVEQRGFDTPASVDVVDGKTIREGQLQVNLSEPLARVPGVVALNRQNYAQDIQISVRGFGARSTFGVRGLRLYADGIPATAPDGQGQVSHFDLASASRLEVLRGPFSALYGNSSGGVISLFTADGGPDTQVEFSGAAGSDGVRRAGVQLSGQEGRARYRVSATGFETDGAREHSAAQRRSFNGKLRFDANEDSRLTFVLNSMRMPDTQDPLGLTRAEFEADPRRATPVALQFDTRKSVDQTQLGAVLDQRLDAQRSVQLTAYYGERSTVQFQAIPVATQTPPTHPGGVIDLSRRYGGLDARFIQRTRLAERPLTLTAGLSADRIEESRRGFQNFVGPMLGVQGALRRDEANSATTLDPYVQAEWQPALDWRVSAGLRHSRVRFESRDRYVVPGNGNDSGAVDFSATTPALGVVWHASDALNLYAAWGRGFETPTLNELAYRAGGGTGLNLALDAARSRQWELGAKAQLGERWAANAAYFQARTQGEIVVLTNAGGRSTFRNAGRTKREGVEASLSGRLGQGWSVYGAATWLTATYRDAFLTCTAAPCTTPSVQVASGNRIPGIPRTSAFAELAWAHRPWGMETALEWRHVGRIFVDDRNSDAAAASSVFNLRVGWEQKLRRWALREFVRVDNLADRKYSGSVIVNEGNARYFEPAPGRTWLVGFAATHTF